MSHWKWTKGKLEEILYIFVWHWERYVEGGIVMNG